MTDDNGWAGVAWDTPGQFERNRARAGFDRRQMFQMGFVYELPGADNLSGAADAILGGWQVSGILALLSGQPFDVRASGASLNTPGERQHADQVGEVNKLGNVGSDGTFYNTNAFAPVTDQRFGSSGKNILDRPGITNLDISLSKKIPINEKVNAQFRAEFFNFLNTPNFGQPNIFFGTPGFGRILSARDAREVQFGVKLLF